MCAFNKEGSFRDLYSEIENIIEMKVGKLVRISIICTPEYELDLAHSNELF